jgi:hypothetical protein
VIRRRALKYDDKEVEDVEDKDNAEDDPYQDLLPSRGDDAQQEDANHVLDQNGGNNVEEFTEPAALYNTV